MLNRKQILKKLKSALSHQRFNHSLGVEAVAVALARNYGVSVKQASIAALLHDYARKFKSRELLQQARKNKIKIPPLAKIEPKLIHAELSAHLAKKDFGIRDKAVLSAVKKHTLGTPNMTGLEKIIYLADHLEEGRNFSGIKKLRNTAFKSLNQAIVLSCANKLKYLLDHNLPIDPRAILTLNYYLAKS